MSQYTVKYSDSDKPPILIDAGRIDDSTSLRLIGPNAPGYGEKIAINFLQLLENFANVTPPKSPTEGQLWYDTSNSDDKKLKIFDNATWYPINGIHQQSLEPTNVKKGDVWIDTASLQLKICSSPGNWVTVGADFSLGLQTGAENITITGTDEREYPVIVSYLNGDVICILAKDTFKPISIIEGFDTIVPGLNLSTRVFGNSIPRVLGIASEATALRVSLPVSQAVSANFFLRKDIPQSLTESLVIDNNTGLRIGATSSTVLVQKLGNDAVISSLSRGSSILLNVADVDGLSNSILAVDGGEKRVRIGVSSGSPTATLDVRGTLNVTSATSISNSLTVSGNIGTLGNLSVSGSVSVSGISTFTNTINSRTILPISETDDLGSSTKIFKNLWVETITAATFNGNANSANRLNTTRNFSLTGQISSEVTPFNGDNNLVLTGSVNYKSISEQTSTSTVGSLYSLAVTTGTTLYKVSKSDFLSDVTPGLASSGMIMSWAGTTIPDGWVLCDGTTYNQSGTYNSLFAVIGITYGSTAPGTFQVPNLPSLVAVGPISVRYIIKV